MAAVSSSSGDEVGSGSGVEAETAAGGPLRREQQALQLLRRPGMDYRRLTAIPAVGRRAPVDGEYAELAEQIDAQVEIQARYTGYVERQQMEIERQRRQAEQRLPDDIDYDEVRGLSHEVRQKLSEARPVTVGQAGRVPGVTPAAVSLLLVHLKRWQYQQKSA